MKYKIGDRVASFQKTLEGFSKSKAWVKEYLNKTVQPYLYIIDIYKDCYILDKNNINNDGGYFFAECDFRLYKPYRRIIRGILNEKI